MSKRQAKSQASSARAASTAFGAGFGTSSSPTAFGVSSSQLSYVTEPPDLSSISDPNVVVYFRNLSKKDSTTKAKALEDLQAYVASLKEPVEEGLLEAWVRPTDMYIHGSCSNLRWPIGKNIPSFLNRQWEIRSSQRAYFTGPARRWRWKAIRQIHAKDSRCMALWSL